MGIIPKGCVCAFNHHHQHVPVFLKAWANRLLEIMYGLHTGIVGHGWVLHHSLGHHVNYLDQKKDESRWMTKSGRPMGELEYTLNVTLTAYPRCYQVGKKYPRQQLVFLSMCVVTFSIVAALTWYRPLPALFVFIIPMINSLTMTSWATYRHHSGLSTETHFTASENTIQRAYNIATGNLGYHTRASLQTRGALVALACIARGNRRPDSDTLLRSTWVSVAAHGSVRPSRTGARLRRGAHTRAGPGSVEVLRVSLSVVERDA